MAIRPIDMQLVVPKTLDYSNKQQGEINKQLSDQHSFAHIAQKNTEQKQTTVINTDESKEMDQSINKDGRSKQEYQGRKKNKSKKEEPPEGKAQSTGTGLFDIRI